jgi:hypothetical protein
VLGHDDGLHRLLKSIAAQSSGDADTGDAGVRFLLKEAEAKADGDNAAAFRLARIVAAQRAKAAEADVAVLGKLHASREKPAVKLKGGTQLDLEGQLRLCWRKALLVEHPATAVRQGIEQGWENDLVVVITVTPKVNGGKIAGQNSVYRIINGF